VESTAPAAATRVRAGRQRAVFLIVSSGAVLATLDQFVVNLAFPSISRSLHGSVTTVSWVLNGYAIVFAALLIPAGRLADRNGRKGGFLIGIAVFTLASAACAFSSSLGELIAARVVQGTGAALVAAAVGALSLGVVEAPGWGWGSPRAIGAFAASALLAGLFAGRSSRHPSPVVELSLLRVRRFGIAAAGAVLYGASYASALLSITLWIQTGWNWSPLRFGIVFAGGPLIVFLLAPGTGRIIRLAGVAATAAVGFLLLAASALVRIALIGPAPSYLAVLPVVALTGLGVGLTLPTLISAGSDALPPHRLATGSGVLSMARQLGLSVGIAVAVSILGSTGHGREQLATFRHAWIAAAALGIAGAAVAILLFRHGHDTPVTSPGENEVPAEPGLFTGTPQAARARLGWTTAGRTPRPPRPGR
jgi:MFS family permease